MLEVLVTAQRLHVLPKYKPAVFGTWFPAEDDLVLMGLIVLTEAKERTIHKHKALALGFDSVPTL